MFTLFACSQTCCKSPSTAPTLQLYSIRPKHQYSQANAGMCICSCTQTCHTSINTSIRGMQSAWCIIQWPPVGGFSQCCDHNVCAQTLLQLWIHNEKVLKDTNCAHSSPSLWGQETQKITVEIRFLVSPEKQQIMTVNTLRYHWLLPSYLRS